MKFDAKTGEFREYDGPPSNCHWWGAIAPAVGASVGGTAATAAAGTTIAAGAGAGAVTTTVLGGSTLGATAIAPAVAGTAAGFSWGTAALYGLTGLAALSSLRGGQLQSQDYAAQARLSEVQAEREAIAGIQEQNQIRRDLLRRLAANAAIGGASGLTLDGSFTTVNEELQQDAERQLNISRSNANVKALSSMAQRGLYVTRSQMAYQKGVTGAATSLLSLATRL